MCRSRAADRRFCCMPNVGPRDYWRSLAFLKYVKLPYGRPRTRIPHSSPRASSPRISHTRLPSLPGTRRAASKLRPPSRDGHAERYGTPIGAEVLPTRCTSRRRRRRRAPDRRRRPPRTARRACVRRVEAGAAIGRARDADRRAAGSSLTVQARWTYVPARRPATARVPDAARRRQCGAPRKVTPPFVERAVQRAPPYSVQAARRCHRRPPPGRGCRSTRCAISRPLPSPPRERDRLSGAAKLAPPSPERANRMSPPCEPPEKMISCQSR